MAFAVDDNAATEMLVAAGITYEVIAASCSSPQTAEINAQARAGTLMKWVHVGMAQALLFGGVAVWIQAKRGRPWWPIALGVSLAVVLLYLQYAHALRTGLEQPGEPTETY